MFKPELVRHLLNRHADALTALNAVEQALRDDFYKLEEPIRAIILAAASGEPLLFVGPPGAAKSALIRRFCAYLKIGREDGYFEYLLTPFTEPGELFGFFDIREFYRMASPNGQAAVATGAEARQIKGAEARQMRGIPRMSRHMLQEARVVFLDEVFNGSSAILNSLLTLMNERLFFDQGERTELKDLHCIFAATNQLPASGELRAVYDRFLIRCEVRNLEPDPGDLLRLLEKGLRADAGAEPPFLVPGLLEKLGDLSRDVRRLGQDPDCLKGGRAQEVSRALARKIAYERQYSSPDAASNRRVVRGVRVMLVNLLLRLAGAGAQAARSFGDDDLSFSEKEDLSLFERYLTDRTRDRVHEAVLGDLRQ